MKFVVGDAVDISVNVWNHAQKRYETDWQFYGIVRGVGEHDEYEIYPKTWCHVSQLKPAVNPPID